MIHLDTNIVVECLRGNGNVIRRLHENVPNIRISSVTLAELLFGAEISNKPEFNRARIAEFVKLAPVVPLDEKGADSFAKLKTDLRRKGKPTGDLDALIAAIAIARSATLITHNRKDFENIPGLDLDDWQ